MGIKFRCPNGHKLHVKAFLAGKRGICPKCGTKFNIPLTSGGQVASVGPASSLLGTPTTGSPAPAISAIIPTTAQPEPALPQATALEAEPAVANAPPTPAPLPATPTVPTPNDPLADAPDAQWHVRSESGGQFGPAAADIMRQWLDEGRITDDSFVWRDGWAEWRKAGEVFPQLVAPAAFTPTPALEATPPLAGPASRHKAGRRKSKQSAMMLSAILLLAVVALAVVLAVVFWFQK